MIINLIDTDLILIFDSIFNRKNFLIKVIKYPELNYKKFIKLLYFRFTLAVTNLLVLKINPGSNFRLNAVNLIKL